MRMMMDGVTNDGSQSCHYLSDGVSYTIDGGIVKHY